MSDLIAQMLTYTIFGSLAIHMGLMGYAVWRVWKGSNEIDRLLATELVSTLVMAVLVLIALLEKNDLFLDVALGLGILGFIGVVAYAKVVTDKRMF